MNTKIKNRLNECFSILEKRTQKRSYDEITVYYNNIYIINNLIFIVMNQILMLLLIIG